MYCSIVFALPQVIAGKYSSANNKKKSNSNTYHFDFDSDKNTYAYVLRTIFKINF